MLGINRRMLKKFGILHFGFGGLWLAGYFLMYLNLGGAPTKVAAMRIANAEKEGGGAGLGASIPFLIGMPNAEHCIEFCKTQATAFG